jgi:hypothetical protein
MTPGDLVYGYFNGKIVEVEYIGDRNGVPCVRFPDGHEGVISTMQPILAEHVCDICGKIPCLCPADWNARDAAGANDGGGPA